MSEEYEGYTVVVIPKEKQKPKLKKPRRYKVIILNDDYTPMEFVVGILKTYFHKTTEDANAIMLDIHKNGKVLLVSIHLMLLKQNFVKLSNTLEKKSFL